MSPLAGIGMKILATLAFSVMSVLVHEQTQALPAGEVIFFRTSVGLIPVMIWLAMRGEFPLALVTHAPMKHVVRAVIGLTSMSLWFAGLAYTPMGEAQAIAFSGPLLGVGLAAWMLGEVVGPGRWLAVAVGFVGVLTVLSEHLGDLTGAGSPIAFIGALLIFGSALTNALVTTHVRQMTMTETTGSIVFYFTLISTVLSGLSVLWGWKMPDATQWAHLILMGLCGGVGQVLMTQAYRYAEASIIAPFEYFSMLWVVILAWFLFGEVPTPLVIIGALVIVGSGMFLLMPSGAPKLKGLGDAKPTGH